MPSIVAQVGNFDSIMYPFQRKIFYANGRFWVFYFDNGYIYYRSSNDGISWSDAIQLRSVNNPYDFSLWFDGQYLHYVCIDGQNIYYRRGIPNPDGSITWSADEQLVLTSSESIKFPFIAVDSFGYPWIVYIIRTYGAVMAVKSSRNDGVWETESGFPQSLDGFGHPNVAGSIIPLTNGKMLAIYTEYSGLIYARAWDGSSWLSKASTIYNIIVNPAYHSAVAQGDDAHVVFLRDSSYDIIYAK